MGGFQADGGADAGFEGFFPRFDADAPAVAGFKAWEAELGTGGDEVVADGGLVAEEFFVDEDADCVAAHVVGAGVAFSVAVETGERVGAAGLECAAENVFDHLYQGTPRGLV